MQFKPKAITSAVVSAMMLISLSANAKDQIVAEQISVSGILPDRLESVPGSFSVIDEKELQETMPFTIKEALAHTPGIHTVGEDSFGLGLNIGVRGMDPRRTSRTLLMEDGMPLFLAPYGDPSAHYSTPLERIQRIEIVKGSGQVLSGPQTVGGMINFVTQPIPKDGLGGSATASLGNNGFTGIHANVGYGGELGGIMLDVLQKKGDGIRNNHNFDVREYTLKGMLRISERQTIFAKISRFTEDSHISETGLGTHEYAENKFQAPTGHNDKFEQERNTFQLQHVLQFSERAKLSTQVYRVTNKRASFRQIDASGGYDDETPGSSTGYSIIDRCDTAATKANADTCGGRWRPREYSYWGIEPRLDFSHKLFGIDSDAVIGMRYHVEDIERNQFRDADPRAQSQAWATKYGDHREEILIDTKAWSYYAQNTFHIGNWSLTPGIRVEEYRIKTDVTRAGGDTQSNPESKLDNRQTVVLPGLGAAWNGIANTTIFAGVHKGFAPPRPDRDLRADGQDTAVVDKTKAEESTNWEIGVRSNDFKGSSFQATLFHTDFDEIVINNGAGTFINGGESQMSGLELAGRIDFGRLFNTAHNVYLMGSYTNLFNAKFMKDGQNADNGIEKGARLPYAPRHLASLSVGYQHPVGVDARIGVDYVGSQEPDTFARVLDPVDAALSGLSGSIHSYTLLNASFRYKPQGSKVSYFLSGHNLTDKEYLATRVDGMAVGRQRQVVGGVKYEF